MGNYSEYFPYAFAIVIAIPFLLLLRQFVHNYITLKKQEIQVLGIKSGNELRFQAFERLILFLERIKPTQLVSRFDKTLAPHEFVFLTEKSITEEFDYNASLQLYVSKNNWLNLINAKEAVIKTLYQSLEGLGKHATLEDYKTVFLLNYADQDISVSQTMEELKKEILILNFKT